MNRKKYLAPIVWKARGPTAQVIQGLQPQWIRKLPLTGQLHLPIGGAGLQIIVLSLQRVGRVWTSHCNCIDYAAKSSAAIEWIRPPPKKCNAFPVASRRESKLSAADSGGLVSCNSS